MLEYQRIFPVYTRDDHLRRIARGFAPGLKPYFRMSAEAELHTQKVDTHFVADEMQHRGASGEEAAGQLAETLVEGPCPVDWWTVAMDCPHMAV